MWVLLALREANQRALARDELVAATAKCFHYYGLDYSTGGDGLGELVEFRLVEVRAGSARGSGQWHPAGFPEEFHLIQQGLQLARDEMAVAIPAPAQGAALRILCCD